MQPVKRVRKPKPATTAVSEVAAWETIDDRRGEPGSYEYRVRWEDGSESWVARAQLIEDGNEASIENVDRYLARYPNREIRFVEFLTRDCRAAMVIADRNDNSCVAHAIQMVFELMGHQQAADAVPAIWEQYRADSQQTRFDVTRGFQSSGQIGRFLRTAIPATGLTIDTEAFKHNYYYGEGCGYITIAKAVVLGQLPPGHYLLAAYRRNMRCHCVAMQVTIDQEVLIREDSTTTGIGDQKWFKAINFIRPIVIDPPAA